MRLASILSFLLFSSSAAVLAASCAAPVVSTPTPTAEDAGKDDGGRVPAGECGTCPAGAKCVQGACQCPSGQTECGDACVDTKSDARNCGACGNTCGSDAGGGGTWTCVTGTCTLSCSGSAQACGGRCVDTQSDTANCGSCGNACAGGRECCKGSCSLTQTDPQNCGSCGNSCSGTTPDCCGGGCVNKQTDKNNCGTCGNVCPGTTPCTNGKCCQTPTNGACGKSLCQTSASPMTPGCDGVQGCVNKVCLQDSFCCSVAWDSVCVSEVDQFCAPLKCMCN
jgi:hypothetical protein